MLLHSMFSIVFKRRFSRTGSGQEQIDAYAQGGDCNEIEEPVTTTDSAFCPGSKLAFVPVLEPGQGFQDKSPRGFYPGW